MPVGNLRSGRTYGIPAPQSCRHSSHIAFRVESLQDQWHIATSHGWYIFEPVHIRAVVRRPAFCNCKVRRGINFVELDVMKAPPRIPEICEQRLKETCRDRQYVVEHNGAPFTMHDAIAAAKSPSRRRHGMQGFSAFATRDFASTPFGG